MNIWILVIISIVHPNQTFLKAFDNKEKCVSIQKEFEPIYYFKCVKVPLNK